MKLKDLVLGLIILLLIYLIYIWFFTDSTKYYLLASITDAKSGKKTIDGNKLPRSLSSSDFTYCFWAYIDNWEDNNGKEKYIIFRPNLVNSDKGTKIYLDKNVNDLVVKLKKTGTGTQDNEELDMRIPNIPLQRWVCIIVTVNNRSCDGYIDGKLIKTEVADNVLIDGGPNVTDIELLKAPSSSTSTSANEADGFAGSIGNVLYYTRSVSPREAYAIYKEGPGGGNSLLNVLNRYGLKFSFLSQGKELHKIVI